MKNITQNNEHSNFKALMELLKPEGFRRVCRALEHAIGTAEASLYAELLGRFEYFQDRGQLDDEGYFFNTVIDLEHGTALSNKKQRTAITRLENLKLISTKLKGSPPRRYFKINDDEEILFQYLHDGKLIMDQLKENIKKQSAKVEEDRDKKQGYFDPKYKRTSKCATLEHYECANTEHLNVLIRNTNKNKVNKNKREEEEPTSTLLNIYLENLNEKNGSKVKTTNKQNIKALEKLVKLCGAEEAAELLEVWFAKADQGTANKGWPVGFLLNQLSEYKNKLQDYQEEQRREAAAAERKKQLLEEERQRDKERHQEEARRAALTDEQRKLEDITKKRETINSLLGIWQEQAAADNQEAQQKVQDYQQKLQALAIEEANLLPQLKEG